MEALAPGPRRVHSGGCVPERSGLADGPGSDPGLLALLDPGLKGPLCRFNPVLLFLFRFLN